MLILTLVLTTRFKVLQKKSNFCNRLPPSSSVCNKMSVREISGNFEAIRGGAKPIYVFGLKSHKEYNFIKA